MQIVDLTYAAYQAAPFDDRRLVRAFHQWDAWAAIYQARPVLVLDEYVRQCVTVCVYASLDERDADIKVLRALSDKPPSSPSRTGGGVPPLPSVPAALRLPLPPPPKRDS